MDPNIPQIVESITTQVQYPLQKVNRLPDACFAEWKLSDNSIEVHPLTTQSYAALHIKDARAPKNLTSDPDAKWLKSWSEARYDTPSGNLEPGDICLWEEGSEFFNKGGESAIVVGVDTGSLGKLDSKEIFIPQTAMVGSLDDLSSLSAIDPRESKIQINNGILIITKQ